MTRETYRYYREDSNMPDQTNAPGGLPHVEKIAITGPPDDGVVHYCHATDHCIGGRRDTGSWDDVTCPECLKSASYSDDDPDFTPDWYSITWETICNVLEDAGVKTDDVSAAQHIGVSTATINTIRAGERVIDQDLARTLSEKLGSTPEFWLRRDRHWRAHKARIEAAVEKVNHPAHYGGGENPYEVIKVLFAWGWGEDFCKANTVKYLARAGRKIGESKLDDLKKAKWYLDALVNHMEKTDGDG